MSKSLPLEGIRVVEMCWVWSGPMMGQYLADLGAEVIKVEWFDRFDLYRTRGVERLRGKLPEQIRRESSFSFHSLNRGKLGMTADLKQQSSLDVLKMLLHKSDLLIENFTVGTLDRLGLGQDVLKEVNDKLVVVSLSASGRGSSVEALRAYGLVLSALGGAESLLTESDGTFVGSPTFVVSDPNASAFGAFVSLAGLLHALRTGRGATYECSQIEMITSLMLAERDAEHGEPWPSQIVLCSDDEYVAVSVAPDSPIVDVDLDDWAGTRTSDEALAAARESGCLAAVVTPLGATESALEFASADVRVPTLHPITGPEEVVAAPWRVDGKRPVVRKAAPILGESNQYVFRRVLGLDEERISQLIESGAFNE